MITTQKDLRTAFWLTHTNLPRKGRLTQNEYPADTRMAWCDFVEMMRRGCSISESLAQRAVL